MRTGRRMRMSKAMLNRRSLPAPHYCHANNCFVEVPPRMFMCRAHWFALPQRLRDAIWLNYVPGQEDTKTPTAEYLRVAATAIAWLEKHGG